VDGHRWATFLRFAVQDLKDLRQVLLCSEPAAAEGDILTRSDHGKALCRGAPARAASIRAVEPMRFTMQPR